MHFTAQTSTGGIVERDFHVACIDAPGHGDRPPFTEADEAEVAEMGW